MPFQIDIPRDWIIEAEAWEWAAVVGIAGAIALRPYADDRQDKAFLPGVNGEWDSCGFQRSLFSDFYCWNR